MTSPSSSLKLLILTLSSLLLFSLFPHPASAQDNKDLYLIPNISVQSTEPSPVKAKESAFRQAQEQAFQILLLNLVSPENIKNLPPPSQPFISSLIRDITFLEEKISEGFYSARLDIRFQPEKFKHYLSQFGIEPSVNIPSSILIVPLYQEVGISRLWERNNLWLNAWEQHHHTIFNGVEIVLPKASLQDMDTLSARDVLGLNEKKMLQLAQAYNTDDFIVTFAKMEPDLQNNQIQLIFQVLPFIHGASSKTLKFSLYPKSIGKIPQEMNKATAQIIQFITDAVSERQKQANLQPPTHQQQTFWLQAPISSVSAFLSLHQQLSKIPQLSNIKTLRVSKNKTLLSLSTGYKTTQIIRILASHAIIASPDPSNPFLINLSLPQ